MFCHTVKVGTAAGMEEIMNRKWGKVSFIRFIHAASWTATGTVSAIYRELSAGWII